MCISAIKSLITGDGGKNKALRFEIKFTAGKSIIYKFTLGKLRFYVATSYYVINYTQV